LGVIHKLITSCATGGRNILTYRLNSEGVEYFSAIKKEPVSRLFIFKDEIITVLPL
jgi:hypothetical protein